MMILDECSRGGVGGRSEIDRPPLLSGIRTLCALSALALAAPHSYAETDTIRDIGSRVEMFVDRFLIAREENVSLRLHSPVEREIVLELNMPWELNTSQYFTLFRDGTRYRAYYRGGNPRTPGGEKIPTYWCYAESTDGITFTRPNLGLVEFAGSKQNNILFDRNSLGQGMANLDNFAPFLDANPKAPPEERYKALAGGGHGKLFAYVSADGIHWRPMQKETVSTEGGFDTTNTTFWDENTGTYRSFWRYFDVPGAKSHAEANAAVDNRNVALDRLGPGLKDPDGIDLSNADRQMRNWVRAIESTSSRDFRHWEKPRPHVYPPDAPREHLYSNATTRVPGAPHMLVSFPKRFFPGRTKVAPQVNEMMRASASYGVSDVIFMSSRDGEHWDRTFQEAWIRPGSDPLMWANRNGMIMWGILETASDEFSLYRSERYWRPDNRLRRMSIRRHGFASIHAGTSPGEMVTKQLRFRGKELAINYSTSASGYIQVEIQKDNGQPVPGFALADCTQIYGDEIEQVVSWKGGGDVSRLQGQPVRLRFVMSDADLYSVRFRP